MAIFHYCCQGLHSGEQAGLLSGSNGSRPADQARDLDAEKLAQGSTMPRDYRSPVNAAARAPLSE